MDVSRLTFTDDFEKKLHSRINQREKAALRNKRLEELDKSGELQNIKTRFELGLACGFNKNQYSRINSWVGYLVNKKKCLTETFVGFNEHSRATYEYHYCAVEKKKPIYHQTNATNACKPENVKVYNVKITIDTVCLEINITSFNELLDIVKTLKTDV